MRAPDSPVAITAYRVWGTTGAGSETRLQSTAAGFWSTMPEWAPGRRFEAACLAPGRCPDDGIPGLRHRCGIYALKELDAALEWAGHIRRVRSTVVVGEVSLWGAVVESPRGWRAQYAYPAAFLAARTRRGKVVDLDTLAASYAVPVREPRAA